MALLDGVADERIARLQIEHVELVDGGRDHDERPCAHFVGERPVLDELDQLVLEDDRSWRHREIAADFERLLVGHRDPALADIVDQVLDPCCQAVAARVHGTPKRLWIGGEIIRGTQRIQDLACKESELPASPLVYGGTFDEIAHVANVDKIGLFQKVVERAFSPLLAGKPTVAFCRLDRCARGMRHGAQPQGAHSLQVILLNLRHFREPVEICPMFTAGQQRGRELQHQRLVCLREAGDVFERNGVVHRTPQCSFTCGSVRRVIRRASVSSVTLVGPCSAYSCIL